jgi:hypothetical protein
MSVSLAFEKWKYRLLANAGDASPAVLRNGELILELLYRDGCEPTMDALMGYAQAELCRRHQIHAVNRESSARVPDSPSDNAPR